MMRRPKVARPQAVGCGKADIFFNGDSSGSARKPRETSISSREAQRAAPPADGSRTMFHRNTSDLHYIFLIH
jgi:hypothetical protein